MSGLECGHRFCKLCWGEYLKTKVMDEGMGQVNLTERFMYKKKTFPSNTTLTRIDNIVRCS
jgi:hypothetical protein